MSIWGWIFMTVSLTCVLTLVTWCYRQVLKAPPGSTAEPPAGLGP